LLRYISRKLKSKDYYIYDDIFSLKELLWIYHTLLNSNSWSLIRSTKKENIASKPFGSFPGMDIENNGIIYNDYLSGYFKSLIFRVQKNLKEENGIDLPDNIIRISVGAKSSQSKTSIHFDSYKKDRWTILGFLNPVWNNEDGGEFYIEKHKINYLPGRIIIFPSNLEHDGGYIRNENLNYWRISLNIILGD